MSDEPTLKRPKIEADEEEEDADAQRIVQLRSQIGNVFSEISSYLDILNDVSGLRIPDLIPISSLFNGLGYFTFLNIESDDWPSRPKTYVLEDQSGWDKANKKKFSTLQHLFTTLSDIFDQLKGDVNFLNRLLCFLQDQLSTFEEIIILCGKKADGKPGTSGGGGKPGTSGGGGKPGTSGGGGKPGTSGGGGKPGTGGTK
uniref:Collagen-like protein n=1 Tax=Meloidogyne hapla TaxID=6305 RepID=A0A1I8C2F7_MELHA